MKEFNKKENFYLSKCDSNGVPLLKRIEKYPDLPENEFIPLVYPGIKEKTYVINKLGVIKNIKTENILNGSVNLGGYRSYCFSDKCVSCNILLHRIVASTFLENPNPEIYKVVNHIDSNKLNNSLSNLEFTTQADNNSVEKVNRIGKISENKLINYVALNDNSEEVFRVTRYDILSNIYNIDSIVRSINKGRKYKGYYWKKDNEKIIPGFSGNLEDYDWLEHWKYPKVLYVCKEGFIKIDDNISYCVNSIGYVISRSRKYNISNLSHRIIMEYLLGRDLKKDEIVDHINTIKTDNSFDNLRVTDFKGNMGNPLTIKKLHTTRLVLTDLSGKFIMDGYSKEVYKFVYEKESNLHHNSMSIVDNNILNKKYLCIKKGDIKSLHRKMENIIYVFNKDKTELLGFYHSAKEASKNTIIKPTCIYNHIHSKTIAPDGKYYLKGPDAVKLVISLGYGMAN